MFDAMSATDALDADLRDARTDDLTPPAPTAPRKARTPRVLDDRVLIAPGKAEDVRATKAGSKRHLMAEALAKGATIEEMVELLGWENPIVRERLVESRRAMWRCEDYRNRRRDALHKFWDGNANQRAKVGQASREAHERLQRSVLIEGRIFCNLRAAHEATRINYATMGYRCNESTSERFRWWHTIPNHNDPMHDGLEECAAILEWARANPNHENLPDWAKHYLDHVPTVTPGRA